MPCQKRKFLFWTWFNHCWHKTEDWVERVSHNGLKKDRVDVYKCCVCGAVQDRPAGYWT